jgi:hypothetical protein
MNRTKLVLEIFNPNENGVSRWVSKNEFTGKYEKLRSNNGNQWYRNPGLRHLILEVKKVDKVMHWRFNGFEVSESSRPIKKDIREEILKNRCSHTGFGGTKNNKLIVDHKNGRYSDDMVLSVDTQSIKDFQSLCNQANLQKRTDCSECVRTGVRFNAKTLGYNVSQIEGTEKYEGSCVGCYWFDCIKFKQDVNKK